MQILEIQYLWLTKYCGLGWDIFTALGQAYASNKELKDSASCTHGTTYTESKTEIGVPAHPVALVVTLWLWQRQTVSPPSVPEPPRPLSSPPPSHHTPLLPTPDTTTTTTTTRNNKTKMQTPALEMSNQYTCAIPLIDRLDYASSIYFLYPNLRCTWVPRVNGSTWK